MSSGYTIIRQIFRWVSSMLEAVKKRLSHKISLTLAGVMVLLTIAVAISIIQNQERMMEEFTLEKAKLASVLGANMYGTVLEEAVDNGVITVTEAFDHEYELIRGYNWGDKPKFHTKYDFLPDKAVVAFQDKFLETKDFVFAVGVDTNGYIPTHNSRYQQPITGDLEKDMVGNRTKRRFNDPVGKAPRKIPSRDTFRSTDGIRASSCGTYPLLFTSRESTGRISHRGLHRANRTSQKSVALGFDISLRRLRLSGHRNQSYTHQTRHKTDRNTFGRGRQNFSGSGAG